MLGRRTWAAQFDAVQVMERWRGAQSWLAAVLSATLLHRRPAA